ncbi:MAG: hypothetical protein WCG26_15895, partial [Chloroflexales bacterium]
QLGIDALGRSAVLAPVLVVRTGVLAGKTVIAIAAGNGHSLYFTLAIAIHTIVGIGLSIWRAIAPPIAASAAQTADVG